MQKKKPGYDKKVRYSGHREPKPVIYIAGEGLVNKTESAYFSAFKTDNYCVQFIQEGYSDPKGIVRKLKSKINDKNGLKFRPGIDKAFCLVDTDTASSKDSRIREAVVEAEKDKNAPILVLTSNPCFEIWFMLHERYTEKKYNSSSEVVNDLRKIRGWENYSKSDTDTYRKTISKVAVAVQNAKKLEERHLEEGLKPQTVEFMPSSEVYRLVELLLKQNLPKTLSIKDFAVF